MVGLCVQFVGLEMELEKKWHRKVAENLAGHRVSITRSNVFHSKAVKTYIFYASREILRKNLGFWVNENCETYKKWKLGPDFGSDGGDADMDFTDITPTSMRAISKLPGS